MTRSSHIYRVLVAAMVFSLGGAAPVSVPRCLPGQQCAGKAPADCCCRVPKVRTDPCPCIGDPAGFATPQRPREVLEIPLPPSAWSMGLAHGPWEQPGPMSARRIHSAEHLSTVRLIC